MVEEQGRDDERGGVDQGQDEDRQADGAADPAGEGLGGGGERAVDAGGVRPFFDPGKWDVRRDGYVGVEAVGGQISVRGVVEVVGGAEGREEGQDRGDRTAGDQEQAGVRAVGAQAGEEADGAERERGGGQCDDQVAVRVNLQRVRRLPGQARELGNHGRRAQQSDGDRQQQ
ncbi:hypothetical protein GCM10009555_019090 [Acrocarpospora macrocephala]|uniref:Uncharacterized protein n=1 Tax=Acrocarpospora macrocephala TaxID=150177 RepID=A0A5M3WH62_9ACTN|nr:hypothetical protein Amac_011640 [Acrocarpospora macrocephala]